MSRRSPINNFLVGSARIEDRIEYKHAVLRGQLSLLLLAICLFYIVIDAFTGLYMFLPWYGLTVLCAFLVIIFNKQRRFILSSSILLLISNILIFAVADAGSPERGVYLFFLVSAVTGLVLFYQKNLKIGIFFVFVSTTFGLIAYFFDFNLYNFQQDNSEYLAINFTVNFILGVLSSVLVVLFIIKRNSESEASLIANKDKLESLASELQTKNEELQKANDELDRFVYSTSHDLRAPLTTLLGLIEITKVSDNNGEKKKYFEMMTSRIHEMEGFIKEITDYSRNTRLDINREQVIIKEIVDNLEDSFSVLANNAKVKLSHDLPKDLETTTDRLRLNVILNNLLANGIKYHDPSKDKRYVKISASKEGTTLIINIEDNGIGISEDYQDKIFDMFFRASNNSSGSGLGLYIVKETLDKIGGTISFRSKQRIGSKFTIKLP